MQVGEGVFGSVIGGPDLIHEGVLFVWQWNVLGGRRCGEVEGKGFEEGGVGVGAWFGLGGHGG